MPKCQLKYVNHECPASAMVHWQICCTALSALTSWRNDQLDVTVYMCHTKHEGNGFTNRTTSLCFFCNFTWFMDSWIRGYWISSVSLVGSRCKPFLNKQITRIKELLFVSCYDGVDMISIVDYKYGWHL